MIKISDKLKIEKADNGFIAIRNDIKYIFKTPEELFEEIVSWFLNYSSTVFIFDIKAIDNFINILKSKVEEECNLAGFSGSCEKVFPLFDVEIRKILTKKGTNADISSDSDDSS